MSCGYVACHVAGAHYPAHSSHASPTSIIISSPSIAGRLVSPGVRGRLINPSVCVGIRSPSCVIAASPIIVPSLIGLIVSSPCSVGISPSTVVIQVIGIGIVEAASAIVGILLFFAAVEVVPGVSRVVAAFVDWF